MSPLAKLRKPGTRLGFLAIHAYRGRTVTEHYIFGSFEAYQGVPASWGFLLFCALWTFLGVVFILVTNTQLAERALLGYIVVGVEAVAVLSWFAGFIATAANISSDTCPHGGTCGTIAAATAFGAFEWLLFVVTAYLTVRTVFSGSRQSSTTLSGTSKAHPSTQMQSAK